LKKCFGALRLYFKYIEKNILKRCFKNIKSTLLEGQGRVKGEYGK
jgi:hypothetical protein